MSFDTRHGPSRMNVGLATPSTIASAVGDARLAHTVEGQSEMHRCKMVNSTMCRSRIINDVGVDEDNASTNVLNGALKMGVAHRGRWFGSLRGGDEISSARYAQQTVSQPAAAACTTPGVLAHEAA